ncbi:hypothetical protein Tco_0065208 [Tanacetum coccineum]
MDWAKSESRGGTGNLVCGGWNSRSVYEWVRERVEGGRKCEEEKRWDVAKREEVAERVGIVAKRSRREGGLCGERVASSSRGVFRGGGGYEGWLIMGKVQWKETNCEGKEEEKGRERPEYGVGCCGEDVEVQNGKEGVNEEGGRGEE